MGRTVVLIPDCRRYIGSVQHSLCTLSISGTLFWRPFKLYRFLNGFYREEGKSTVDSPFLAKPSDARQTKTTTNKPHLILLAFISKTPTSSEIPWQQSFVNRLGSSSRAVARHAAPFSLSPVRLAVARANRSRSSADRPSVSS
jgi:hypothetical protein